MIVTMPLTRMLVPRISQASAAGTTPTKAMRTNTAESTGMATAFDAGAQIADYDVGVIALYDRQRRKHRIASVRARQGCEDLVTGP